jgi:hypothetical protein
MELVESVQKRLEAQKLAKKLVDERTQEWQKQIKQGDCFKKSVFGIEVYGEVLREYKMSGVQNYRRCRCYSMVNPKGEEGDVHVATIDTLVDRETFEMIKSKLGQQSDSWLTL